MTINVNQDEYIKDAGDTAGIRVSLWKVYKRVNKKVITLFEFVYKF